METKFKTELMKMISTTALAKERNIEPKELFNKLKDNGWIYKKFDQWHLTKEGTVAGGDTQYNPKFGEYVVWPIDIDINQKIDKSSTLTSTNIGKEYNDMSAQKINSILNELGWIEKSHVGGWVLTKFGRKNGGVEVEASNGTPYVVWDKKILENSTFLRSIKQALGEDYNEPTMENISEGETLDDFRLKYPANYRTQDGHRVRSKSEAMIDDYLYRNNIVHAYERRLPGIEESVLSDFYILKGNVYIEFWGVEEDSRYEARKKKKLEIYASEGFNLIQLHEKDVQQLDDILPIQLRKFGVVID